MRALAALAATLMFIGPARVPGFAAWQAPAGAGLPVFGYTIQHIYPHDPKAFTQGLQYVDGVLYEGTGLNGHSSIRKVKLETGEVLQQRDVPDQYFGEGIVVWESALIELTWRSHVAFVYDRESFKPRQTFNYPGEGWGLTHDGKNLIMSDGSAALRLLDPVTFAERRRIDVTAAGVPVKNLNELEFVKGEVFANVWQTPYVARISLESGHVTGWIDLRGLLSNAESRNADVLNGIAYDAKDDRLFVTGKLWPKLFEVRLR
ncbi:MAG TPA: glutaminyl-peptide cyclotransferase [Vicinamibacterales bacterium]|nr:glutaminyl-peptide cyclotransferase [Vicinamibacterales bacterium]